MGRNYLFALNAEWTLDAGLVGNETRFINHATGILANCRAEGQYLPLCSAFLLTSNVMSEVREVNGDHRIGKNILATVCCIALTQMVKAFMLVS